MSDGSSVGKYLECLIAQQTYIERIIWLYQLSWKCKFAIRSDEGLTLEKSAF